MNRAVLAVACLGLLLAAGVVSAQDDDASPTESRSEPAPTGEHSSDSAGAGSDRDQPEGNDTASAQPQPTTDPFDYQSSEQISEDLSVSFPVDI